VNGWLGSHIPQVLFASLVVDWRVLESVTPTKLDFLASQFQIAEVGLTLSQISEFALW
jgi:hypothetical protein